MKQPIHASRLPNWLRFGGAIAATASMSFLSPPLTSPSTASLHDSPKAILDEAWQIVNREYVDTTFNQTDWMAVRQELLSRDYSSTEEAYTALRDALQQLDDPYTRFMDPEQYEQLTNQTSGELSGVGIRLQLDEASGGLYVIEPLPNSPAAVAGLKTGDRILEIDGQSTEGMTVQDASALIRGEIGSRVTLRIERDGQNPFSLPITRDRIELPSVTYSSRLEGRTRVGYIRLTDFSGHAAEQMQQAIEALKREGVEGFVLDLRGNPGGLLQASIDISRMWLGNGSIVRTVDRNGNSIETTANNSALTDLPLAVLVDGNSASSSEILTGALKDNQRATIVGSQTFGKALVQSVHALSDGSGLAVTIAHYYTPNGTDISHLGITPNLQVDVTNTQRQRLSTTPNLVATREDPQYVRAIEALQDSIVASRNARTAQTLSVSQDQRSNLLPQ